MLPGRVQRQGLFSLAGHVQAVRKTGKASRSSSLARFPGAKMEAILRYCQFTRWRGRQSTEKAQQDTIPRHLAEPYLGHQSAPRMTENSHQGVRAIPRALRAAVTVSVPDALPIRRYRGRWWEPWAGRNLSWAGSASPRPPHRQDSCGSHTSRLGTPVERGSP